MAARQPNYEAIEAAVSPTGLRLRGGFHCRSEDDVPGAGAAASLILVGSVGAAGFDAFLGSAEHGDGAADPLDRYSERVIDTLAAALGADPLYPHRGPPWLPFQRWAMRAEGVQPSPLGVLIHPQHGLWHAYRGALLFPDAVSGIPRPVATPSPCAACADRPCLDACPVGAFSAAGTNTAFSAAGTNTAFSAAGTNIAFSAAGYDMAACTAHLATPAGKRCMTSGCQARLACPVAPGLRYVGEQAAFHMAAFSRARNRS